MLTKKQQLQRIVEEYRREGNQWPAAMADVADWAVRTKRYDLTAPRPKKLVARELAQAMREEYITDEKGRRVRAKHPARAWRNGRQLMLWDDIRTAPRDHMEEAFRLRRRRIAAECKQVKTDVDSYNGAHPHERPTQMPLDFTYDVEEMELADKVSGLSPKVSSRRREQFSAAWLQGGHVGVRSSLSPTDLGRYGRSDHARSGRGRSSSRVEAMSETEIQVSDRTTIPDRG